jgi:O-acetyl-ADP-ribose deacetylase (regulator of RNase III)
MKISNGTIEIVRGDIADQDTEAIVNAANDQLWMGSGVAGAIKRKGGGEIERDAIALGPIAVGDSVATAAGKLKAKYVIHSAVMGQNLHTDEEKIRKATRSALALAEQKEIQSVSLPAFGTGVGGFSIYHCAKIMLMEAVEFLMTAKHVRLIRFVLFTEEDKTAFESELKMEFSMKRH